MGCSTVGWACLDEVAVDGTERGTVLAQHVMATGRVSHPGSEKMKPKPLYVCSGCSSHTYDQQYGEQIQYLIKLQTRIFTK
jgi:hypothetical protein